MGPGDRGSFALIARGQRHKFQCQQMTKPFGMGQLRDRQWVALWCRRIGALEVFGCVAFVEHRRLAGICIPRQPTCFLSCVQKDDFLSHDFSGSLQSHTIHFHRPLIKFDFPSPEALDTIVNHGHVRFTKHSLHGLQQIRQLFLYWLCRRPRCYRQLPHTDSLLRHRLSKV